MRAIGLLEVLGALGLVQTPLTGIAPGLVLAAAVGFLLTQVGAIALHLSRGETKVIGLNIGLFVLAGAEIWLAGHRPGCRARPRPALMRAGPLSSPIHRPG